MKVNLFQTQENDFKVLLDKFGVTVKVNNIDMRVIITNTSINELDDKYISSTIELKRGDHIVMQDKDWYVISQVKTRRYESYKAIIRCAEHYIRFNLSVKSGSAYDSYDVKEVPCIVQTSSDFGLDNGRQMMLGEGELAIFAQDNATTRAIYASFTDSTRKHDIVIDNRQFAYQGFDFISKGLVRINVKVTSTGTNIDKINSIAWDYPHSSWDGVIDASFYKDHNPSRTTTSVGAIVATTTNSTTSTNTDGVISVTFELDSIATKYRVSLMNASNVVVEIKELLTNTVNFTGLSSNTYSIRIESFNGSEYLTPQQSNAIVVSYDTGSGWGEW